MGHEEELMHIIPVLLGCDMENMVEGNLIKTTSVQNLLRLMKETAYSHLMEVCSLNSRKKKIFFYLTFFFYHAIISTRQIVPSLPYLIPLNLLL